MNRGTLKNLSQPVGISPDRLIFVARGSHRRVINAVVSQPQASVRAMMLRPGAPAAAFGSAGQHVKIDAVPKDLQPGHGLVTAICPVQARAGTEGGHCVVSLIELLEDVPSAARRVAK